MSDNYYERIGEILNNSFSKNIDPFELANKKDGKKRGYKAYQENRDDNEARRDSEKIETECRTTKEMRRSVPKDLIKDFLIIKVVPGSSLEECKHSWKCLLKKYHPDLSSESKDNNCKERECDELFLINDSFRRIEAWFMSQKS